MRLYKSALNEDIIIYKVKNPNRRRPGYVFKAQLPHKLSKKPRGVEVSAKKNGRVFKYTASHNFNNYKYDLLNNFKSIKTDRSFVYIEYGYIGEFGVNEEFELIIKVF